MRILELTFPDEVHVVRRVRAPMAGRVSVFRSVEIGEKRVGPRRYRGHDRSNRHGTRDWRIFITLSRCTGPSKDVRRGRWSWFPGGSGTRAARLSARWKGGSRGRFVRLTTVIRSPLRVWRYFSVADYSGGVLFYARLSSREDT